VTDPRDPVTDPPVSERPGAAERPVTERPTAERRGAAAPPEARGPVWTEERRRSDEGRQDLRARRRPRAEGAATPRRRAKNRRDRKYRALFFALAMTGVVAAVVWALLGSRLLVVRSVAVTGTHLVPVSTVLAIADVQPGTPMIRVNTAGIAARVEAIRQVQSVQVIKSWPDRILIEVRERNSAVAVPAQGGGFDLVDPYGVVVRWVASRPARFPLFQTSGQPAALRGDQSVALAAAVLSELPPAMKSSVESVAVPDGQVTLTMSDGETVVWGGTDRSAAKVQVLAILMRTHARYYDVSAPGVALTEG
jgi:cell division protein FtsQ